MRFRSVFIIEEDINILAALMAKLSVIGFLAHSPKYYIKERIFDEILDINPDFLIFNPFLSMIDGNHVIYEFKNNPVIAKKPIFVYADALDEINKKTASNLTKYIFNKNELGIDDFVLKIARTIRNKEKLLK